MKTTITAKTRQRVPPDQKSLKRSQTLNSSRKFKYVAINDSHCVADRLISPGIVQAHILYEVRVSPEICMIVELTDLQAY